MLTREVTVPFFWKVLRSSLCPKAIQSLPRDSTVLACWRGWALAALYMHQIIKGVESDGEGVLLMEWLVHKMNKTGGGA